MSKLEQRTARVEVDEEGDWILSVSGTDIRRRLWNDDAVPYRHFPGNAMGHRLIELGWMPDRRAMYGSTSSSRVEALTRSAMAGWRQAGDRAWTIPCHRELE